MKKGWEIKKLGEVVDVLDNLRKPITKRDRVEGKYPYYGATGILSYVHNYIFSEKLVLIGEDGAKWASGDNTSFIAEGKYWVNNHAHVIRPIRKTILDEWIVYFLNFSDLTHFITGLTVQKLNQEKMRSIPIPLPPLPEQRHIVSILDQTFAAIAKAKANAEQNLKNAKELFESYLQGVFENRGEGWESKELMEVCEQITDGSHFSPKSSGEDEYPYITVRDIDEDIIDFDNCKFICKKDYQSLLKNGCKPNNGDLLFSKDGTVGKVSLVDFEKDFVVLSSLAIIRPKAKIITSSLLKYILKNPHFLQTAIGMKTGVAIRRIILKNLKLIKISFPKSLKEQQTIVQKLEALSIEIKKLEAIYTQKIIDLEELKKSVLQKAFSGELKTAKALVL